MNLDFLNELKHSSGVTGCTQAVAVSGTSREHGGGECHSFFIETWGSDTVIASSDSRIAGKAYEWFTVPKGCNLKVFNSGGSSKMADITGPAQEALASAENEPTLRIKCTKAAGVFEAEF